MVTSYTVTEGTDGQSTVCVELGDGVVERNVTVTISTANGTATSGGQGMEAILRLRDHTNLMIMIIPT